MIKHFFHIADLHFRTFKRIAESRAGCEKFIAEVKEFIEKNNVE